MSCGFVVVVLCDFVFAKLFESFHVSHELWFCPRHFIVLLLNSHLSLIYFESFHVRQGGGHIQSQVRAK